MPLGHSIERYILDPDKLHKADILLRIKKDLGEDIFNLIKNHLATFIKNMKEVKPENAISFGMLMGTAGKEAEVDFTYCWDTVWAKFPNEDFCKRALGTILMHCFALEDRNWLFVDDMEKNKKLSADEIPFATQYFMSDDERVFESYRWPSQEMKDKYSVKSSLDDLMNKFKRKK